MSTINRNLAPDRSYPVTIALNHPVHFLSLLAGFAGALIMPCLQADTVASVTAIARQHIENWNQTLNSGNIEDILDLYTDKQPMVLQPDGKVATKAVEIARFWRTLLTKGDSKFRFAVIESHRYENLIVMRLALSHSGLQRQMAFTNGHGGINIDWVIKQQPDGQWKTQMQNWN